MNLATMCGRILMVGVRGGTMDDPRTREDVAACRQAAVGGVILFATDLGEGCDRNIHHPEQLRRLVGDLRHELGADLIVGIDQEGGRVARLRPERGFEPHVSAASFGRMDTFSQRAQARAQAKQLAGLGVDLNFAPCVDLLVNPDCPVIAGKDRAFSRDPSVAAACAKVWIDEHARFGVKCCLKHFPGHGSATDDTHDGLADITDTYDEPTELAVYEDLLTHYGDRVAVMTGHLYHHAIDPNLPASLSRAHTGGLLRARLGFEGVVVTDSLDMGAVTERFGPADAMAMALDAGADMLLDGANMPGMIRPQAALAISRALVEAVEAGRVRGGEERIERSVQRIARAFSSQSC
jgi:beta-N-acetylhexosaminidase|tara:strand:- start:20006 stop:21058 length:1053 start_codon:yes stop_codon:yes gene_type:complete